jgi:P-type Ca2+ transporter type 2C
MEGLDSPMARQRLQAEGPNEMGWSPRRRWPRLLRDVLSEPMFLLLMAAGGIYSALGEWQDAAVLLGFVAATITITVAQARRTDNALEALRELASPQARVKRDGLVVRIPAGEVVRDDILHLSEGDRVPADAVLLDTHELAADESLLTGESLPVPKALAGERVMAGTLIVKGQGVARVTAIGAHTELGRIGLSLQRIELPASPLHRELQGMTRDWLIAGISLSLLLAVSLWWTQRDLLSAALSGITLAMGLLPQELPVILLVFVALAARRLANRSVLTRRLSAIEALGQVTVLCVDKTGTLTQNRMVLQQVRTPDEQADLPGASPWPPEGAIGQLLSHAALACETQPHDPMEWAIQEATRLHMASQPPPGPLLKEYELSPEWPAMTQVWRAPHSGDLLIASKGAPEIIARMCHLSPEAQRHCMRQVQQMAAAGLRVLAVAHASSHANHPLPSRQEGFSLQWLGLIGLSDPLRPEVPQAVAHLQGAGIRVLMITGDHPVTALAIARQAGLLGEQALTGTQMTEMDDASLAHAATQHRVFARVQPEHKLRLIRALQARGEVVAMTGDGVNDAPALQAAHVGIAMGQPGTDVAREAAALVLLRDDFSLIVEAVRQSRQSIGNLRHAVAYTVAIHLPVAALSLGPVLLDLPAMLAPLHIAFMEMMIGPTCALVFENETSRHSPMQQAPRHIHQPLIDRACLHASFLQGALLAVLLTAAYAWQLHAQIPTPQARTLTFVALVAASMALVTANQQEADTPLDPRTLNRTALVALGLTLAALLMVTTLPPLLSAFGFDTVPPVWWLLTMLSGLALGWPLRWSRMLSH